MHNRAKMIIVSILILSMIVIPLLTNSAAADSDILGQLFKTFGIGYIVDQFSGEINDFINTLTLNRGVEVREETKVVPIITVGSNTYVGAVQVSGPAEKISLVEAVAQLEGDFRDGQFRIRALVPINTKNPMDIKNLDRIEGVGVTALIDIDI